MQSRRIIVVSAFLMLTVCSVASAERRRIFRIFKKNKCQPCVVTTCIPTCHQSSTCATSSRNCSSSCNASIAYRVCPTCQPASVTPGCSSGACPANLAGRILRPVGPPGTVIPGHAIPPNGYIQEPNGRLIPSSPFALSGYVIPPPGQSSGVPSATTNFCESIFLACCASGGANCVSNYQACCAASAEPQLHTRCPSDPGGGPGGGIEDPEEENGEAGESESGSP